MCQFANWLQGVDLCRNLGHYGFTTEGDTPMTITERNQKLYDLRQDLNAARAKVALIERQIARVNHQYRDEQIGDLFLAMFTP